ncbi:MULTISPECIES: hypothetical protein [Bacillaceae]|uniref:hypothetical protein n=1 Tax=Bacillaceae TaxID=186817 RepID=UPI001BDDF944|nr:MULTISPECIES: hypothetical protein [Bacillaceae]MDX8362004.1 hypothetical protein [Cytobacillus sp. IB215316]
MKKKPLESLLFMKKITSVGLILGCIVFLFSFFVSGIKGDYVLSIGLSIMISSMILFGFGLSLNLMEAVSDRSTS